MNNADSHKEASNEAVPIVGSASLRATGGNNRGTWQGMLTPPNQNGGIRIAVQDRQEPQRL
jgi:hypothetical protein